MQKHFLRLLIGLFVGAQFLFAQDIIPLPNEMKTTGEFFTLDANTSVQFQEGLKKQVNCKSPAFVNGSSSTKHIEERPAKMERRVAMSCWDDSGVVAALAW